MATTQPYQQLEWMGIRVCVPDEWEVVRHSLCPEQGSLRLVDRRRERLTLSWVTCATMPNLKRLVSDYTGQGHLEGLGPTPLVTPKPWLGLTHADADGRGTLLRAVHFDAPTSRLVEVLFLTPPGDSDPASFKRLLAGVRVTAAADRAVRWRAFNVDITTPPGFKLVKTDIKPADTQMEFGPVDSRSTKGGDVRVRRRGMARTWYDGSLHDLIRGQEPKVRFTRFEAAQAGEHPAVLAEGLLETRPFARLLGRQTVRRVMAWSADDENAVYQLATSSAADAPLSPEQFLVRSGRVA